MAFTLLKFTEKVDFCDSDYKYTTHMVPKGIDYGLRSKINTKRRKGLEKQLNKKIYQQYLTLKLNDWVTIYEVTYKLCGTTKSIHMLKTTDKNNSQSHIDALINDEIHGRYAMSENYYVSHKILKGPFQPFTKMDKESLTQWWINITKDFMQWLDADEKGELRKQFQKTTGVAVGKRG